MNFVVVVQRTNVTYLLMTMTSRRLPTMASRLVIVVFTTNPVGTVPSALLCHQRHVTQTYFLSPIANSVFTILLFSMPDTEASGRRNRDTLIPGLGFYPYVPELRVKGMQRLVAVR